MVGDHDRGDTGDVGESEVKELSLPDLSECPELSVPVEAALLDRDRGDPEREASLVDGFTSAGALLGNSEPIEEDLSIRVAIDVGSTRFAWPADPFREATNVVPESPDFED